ncbi:MAG: hypothetical protein WKH64_06460 [Chloroflexia bacterium]
MKPTSSASAATCTGASTSIRSAIAVSSGTNRMNALVVQTRPSDQ